MHPTLTKNNILLSQKYLDAKAGCHPFPSYIKAFHEISHSFTSSAQEVAATGEMQFNATEQVSDQTRHRLRNVLSCNHRSPRRPHPCGRWVAFLKIADKQIGISRSSGNL